MFCKPKNSTAVQTAVEFFSQPTQKNGSYQGFPQNVLWKNLWTMWITPVEKPVETCGDNNYVSRTSVRMEGELPNLPLRGRCRPQAADEGWCSAQRIPINDCLWQSHHKNIGTQNRCGEPPGEYVYPRLEAKKPSPWGRGTAKRWMRAVRRTDVE